MIYHVRNYFIDFTPLFKHRKKNIENNIFGTTKMANQRISTNYFKNTAGKSQNVFFIWNFIEYKFLVHYILSYILTISFKKFFVFLFFNPNFLNFVYFLIKSVNHICIKHNPNAAEARSAECTQCRRERENVDGCKQKVIKQNLLLNFWNIFVKW